MRNTAIQVSGLQPDEPHIKSPFSRPSPASVKLHPYMQGINLNIFHNFISLIPPSGHSRNHSSLIFVVSKSKCRVLRSIIPAWIWGFRCVYLLPKSIPIIYFHHPSPLPGTLAVFLWDTQYLCSHPTVEPCLTAIFIDHFYGCYI
jgi:hypothetical protein